MVASWGFKEIRRGTRGKSSSSTTTSPKDILFGKPAQLNIPPIFISLATAIWPFSLLIKSKPIQTPDIGARFSVSRIAPEK